MSDKLEALSQPVAFVYQIAGACVSDYQNPCGKWVDWRTELSCECPPDWMIEEGKVKDLKPRYSQEYVTSLLAALEEKDQRITELETKYQQVSEWYAKMKTRMLAAEGEVKQWHDVATAAAQDDADWHKLTDRKNDLICKLVDAGIAQITRANAAEQREGHLKATADVLSAKNAELETGHSKAAKQVNSWRNLAKQSIAEREKDIAALDVARQRNSELERRNNYFGDGWRPDVDPITGRPFFMWINHPDLGYVPTYGGPYDSFTLAERDSNGEFSVHRYDHDEGAWVDDECVTAQVVEDWLPSNQSELDEHVKEKTAELQQRLQQPIKLKHEYYSPSLKEANTMELNSNGAFMVALDVTDAIRAAGFKVEGE